MKTNGMFFIGESAEIEIRNRMLCAELKHHLEMLCDVANKCFMAGDTLAGRNWSDRAQHIRQVLCDYDELPQTSL
jgi:hypothetical protein